MSLLKVYDKIDVANEQSSFGIAKMQDIYHKRAGKPDVPHRHDYFTILVIKKAKGVHKIDFNSYDLGDQQIYFVSPGQVHQLIESQPSFGFAMTFSTQFLLENSIQLSFVESLNLFQDYGQSPPLKPNQKQFEKIEQFVTEIWLLFHSTENMHALSIGAFLKLFLIACNNICAINPTDLKTKTSKAEIIQHFKNEVNLSFKQEHGTSYYAERLHITPDHLNRIIKSSIGKTAKEYIQSRIMTEAKRLLYFSKLSCNEISFELGFNEAANFSTFFKKHTGYAPSKFVAHELAKCTCKYPKISDFYNTNPIIYIYANSWLIDLCRNSKKRIMAYNTMIKRSVITAFMTVATFKTAKVNAQLKQPTYDTSASKVMFNHTSLKNKTMNTVIHKAATRGHEHHGWLQTAHTFSFANYYNPERMNFGALRVLNDDQVDPGKGFGSHRHENMEIISILLEGDLAHQDNMGNTTVIQQGDVQVMSAGSGVYHSEYNKNQDKVVKFLQIWVLPNKQNVTPRYDQVSIRDIEQQNKFYQILSPNEKDPGVWIHQDAWFSLGKFSKGSTDTYTIQKPSNGIYLFILEGSVAINGATLSKRDGMGIWDVDHITLTATDDAQVLLMDVPMNVK